MSQASALIESTLARFGLPASEARWALDQLVEGRSVEEILLELEGREPFKERFPHIEARRAAGLSPMTPGQIVEYEATARQLMRQAGLPAGFYDDPSDFVDLITADVSLNELNERVQIAEAQVLNAPPEVLDAFMQLTGTSGVAGITALFLDEEKAVPLLEQQVRRAEISGAGRIVGVELDQPTVDRLAELGVSLGSAQQGLLQVQQLSPLFRETASESTDLTESQGARAVFGADEGASNAIQSRLQRRAADFNQGTGGLSGLGTAE